MHAELCPSTYNTDMKFVAPVICWIRMSYVDAMQLRIHFARHFGQGSSQIFALMQVHLSILPSLDAAQMALLESMRPCHRRRQASPFSWEMHRSQCPDGQPGRQKARAFNVSSHVGSTFMHVFTLLTGARDANHVARDLAYP